MSARRSAGLQAGGLDLSGLPKRIAEVVRWTVGPRVLDVGCTGYRIDPASPHFLHARLRERFAAVYGVDHSADSIEKVRALGFDNLFVQSADELDLPDAFDTIVASEVIAHLSNPGRFLERARTHLVPGGRLVVTTPYPFALSYWLYPLVKYPLTNPDRTLAGWLCPQTLRTLASRHGLMVEHMALIEDYNLRGATTLYGLGVGATRMLAPLLPRRLTHNTLVCVLTSSVPER